MHLDLKGFNPVFEILGRTDIFLGELRAIQVRKNGFDDKRTAVLTRIVFGQLEIMLVAILGDETSTD